jgi:ketopantoate hydroxymethyltransferase
MSERKKVSLSYLFHKVSNDELVTKLAWDDCPTAQCRRQDEINKRQDGVKKYSKEVTEQTFPQHENWFAYQMMNTRNY